jgi:replication factor C subunit 1
MNRKLQSLVNYCYDLKFQRPSKEAIIRRIKMVCEDQKLDVDETTLERVIEASGHDIRQIINILQMWKNTQLGNKGFLKNISKDESVMINNFDAAHRLLDHGKTSLDIRYPTFRQKIDLFFIDYDMIPLLIQENYLTAMGDRKSLDDIEKLADAADYISMGDAVSR